MSDDAEKAKTRLKIAHVLLLDIVACSRLLIDEQAEALQEMNQIVRRTAAAKEAEAADQIMRIPTGDGMALVFTGSIEQPVECALEISRALRTQRAPPVRMGIHSGPVHQVADVNQRENIAGAGINIAQRVMDCGDAGHILLSQRVADDLAQYRRWQPYLHELGEVEVKHGLIISVVNLYGESAGNPAPPAKFQAGLRRKRRRRWAAAAAAVVALGAIVGLAAIFSHHRAELVPIVPDKSIAVLPFENRSRDPENAYFAEGIQDEILTRLSKIAALKVIARSSSQKYKSVPDNLREVGRQLGVAHIVEGSVQKVANAVHINVQLIRAADDGQVWGESYDRKVDDVFAVEGEVAQKVAEALKATLTGEEKDSLNRTPTNNPSAYAAYLRGLSLLREDTDAMIRAAIDAFDEAVRLDPQFSLAWGRLAEENALLFFYYDTTPARRARAEQCLLEAERLGPRLPETHLARAYFQYWGMRDYDGARRLLLQLHLIWPGNADIIQALAWISARLGDWQGSNSYFEKAISLNPRDLFLRTGAAFTLMDSRDFAAARRQADDALMIWPDDPSLLGLKAQIFHATGALDQAQAALDQIKKPTDDFYALAAIALQARLSRQPVPALHFFQEQLARSQSAREKEEALLYVGEFQDLAGDKAAAHVTYSRLREINQGRLQAQPENMGDLINLAVVLAVLGDREASLGSLAKAAALGKSDARVAPALEETRIRILARFGETEPALAALPAVLRAPYGTSSDVPLTPAILRLDPDFDSLRGDPRFQKLCEDQSK